MERVSPAERSRLRTAVVASFPIAFALHDLEEVLAAEGWGRAGPTLLRRRLPWLPDPVLSRAELTTARTAVAVGILAVGVAIGTAISWRRRDGDLWPLPALLGAYTVHGGGHVVSAFMLRSYVPGLITVPLVIAPYSVWAWTALHRGGVRRTATTWWREAAAGAAVAASLAIAGHLLAAVLLGEDRVTPKHRSQRSARPIRLR